jgi:hypothetical protein
MDLGRTGWGGMNWIHPVQHRDQWQGLVNAVMNHWVTKILENSSVSQ